MVSNEIPSGVAIGGGGGVVWLTKCPDMNFRGRKITKKRKEKRERRKEKGEINKNTYTASPFRSIL